MCYACERGYEAAIADVVAHLKGHRSAIYCEGAIQEIERGEKGEVVKFKQPNRPKSFGDPLARARAEGVRVGRKAERADVLKFMEDAVYVDGVVAGIKYGDHVRKAKT